MSKLTAILGWGSLIWDPKDLDYNKQLGWIYDGPNLPIEFARISKNGRLTLVITENGTFNKTFYTFANMKLTFEETIENLRKREGCNKKDIGFYKAETDEFHSEDFKYKEEIRNWSNEKKIKNIIWTDLPEKWSYKNENDETINVNPKERIEYLKNLTGEKKELAEEYIIKSPIEIQTLYRKQIEEELLWLPVVKENKKVRYFNPNEKNFFLYSHNLSGFGTLTCRNCNSKDEMHFSGRDFVSIQCQSCGSLELLKDNETISNCECGGKLEKDKPFFCRNCDSFKLSYNVKLLT
ncbi:hypothetical protein [Flavobacterium urocaniciphilum]|uniref:Uncharacterized protein n=1 Tax=Flavobacterium urocaniciphilum TaxID=1299341 RepID=A0A1H9C993_9FLAO|nr:hypothetical protein [Flavobacterium urocaniciphilum]SEP97383.1 hypothetical protein SAMN05444005_10497 [Flavobacterium urocaniciphilum]